MLVSAVWIAPAVLATVSDVVQRRLHGDPPARLDELLWTGGDWLVYAILTPPIFFVSRRWPIARPRIASRALLHLGFAVLFCVAWAISGKLLQLALGLTFRRSQVQEFFASAGDTLWPTIGREVASWIFTTLPFGVVVYLSIAGIAHAIRYFVEARERDVQMAKLSEQLTGARLAALQARLNPHFLFNSLNTIAVLTRDGRSEEAARVVEQLSEVLRRTLDHTQNSEITVEDEIDLVREYLAVEQARFPDRLRPEIAVDPAVLSAAVPALAVQQLVENAIRHGVAARTEAGRVAVTARRVGDTLEVTVTDDGPGISESGAGTPGRGLENTRERLRTLYAPGRASLDVTSSAGGGTLARLRVPYRELALEVQVRGDG
jgi:sensor histidine kinase YesM